MELVVASDLHIHGPEDPLYEGLLILLERRKPGDTVVLAGDIFDLLVGDKALFRKRYTSFFSELKKADARGVHLHYIEGNHDFFLRPAFQQIPRMHVHAEKLSLTLGGKRFFIAHGDLVDSEDLRYRALRRVFRSMGMKAFIKSMPGTWLDRIGRLSSNQSRKKSRRPDVERIRKLFRGFAVDKIGEGYDYVILGHCHDLDEAVLKADGREGVYMNVGYPRVDRSYVAWSTEKSSLHRAELEED